LKEENLTLKSELTAASDLIYQQIRLQGKKENNITSEKDISFSFCYIVFSLF